MQAYAWWMTRASCTLVAQSLASHSLTYLGPEVFGSSTVHIQIMFELLAATGSRLHDDS